MPRYDFSRLSVLVVEDSKFMQSIFVNVLKALGVERIKIANDGEEAISILTPVQNANKEFLGMTGTDVVISDYFMPKLDGGMLLLWLRRADLSPDRFMPFIMVSAAADRDVLFKARDSGVSEFMAKPFSADMVAQRMVAAIEYPRQFVYCTTYFGPDRRRQNRPVERDLRETQPDDIETIYAGKALGDLKNSKKKIWHFRLPNRLQQKLSAGMKSSPDEPAFDPGLLSEAEEKIANMETDYADWVSDSVKTLRDALNRAIEDAENAADHLATINEIALEIRGQGSMFGYPLMTQFGKSLYEFTHKDMAVSPQLLDLIKAHTDLINVVIHQRMKGDGGPVGTDLMNSLDEAKKKYAIRQREAEIEAGNG